jgi:hypothetical protein
MVSLDTAIRFCVRHPTVRLVGDITEASETSREAWHHVLSGRVHPWPRCSTPVLDDQPLHCTSVPCAPYPFHPPTLHAQVRSGRGRTLVVPDPDATSLMVLSPLLSPVCKDVSLELNSPPVAPLRLPRKELIPSACGDCAAVATARCAAGQAVAARTASIPRPQRATPPEVFRCLHRLKRLRAGESHRPVRSVWSEETRSTRAIASRATAS